MQLTGSGRGLPNILGTLLHTIFCTPLSHLLDPPLLTMDTIEGIHEIQLEKPV